MDKEGSKHNSDSVEFSNPPVYQHPPANQYASAPNYGQTNMGYSGHTVVHTMQASSSGPHMIGTIGSVGVVGTNMVPVIVVRPAIGPKASSVPCPSCKEQIVTRVEHQTGGRTHAFAALLCLLGCWPCVAIPYCVDSCKNSVHYCPRCNAYIGTYNAFSQ